MLSLARLHVRSFTVVFFLFRFVLFQYLPTSQASTATEWDMSVCVCVCVHMCMYEFVCLCAPCTRTAPCIRIAVIARARFFGVRIRPINTPPILLQVQSSRRKKRKPIHQMNSTMKFFVFNTRSAERCVVDGLLSVAQRGYRCCTQSQLDCVLRSQDCRAFLAQVHTCMHRALCVCMFVPVSGFALRSGESKSNG